MYEVHPRNNFSFGNNADVEELDMKAPEKPIKYGGGGDDADAAQPNQQLDAADEAESAT